MKPVGYLCVAAACFMMAGVVGMVGVEYISLAASGEKTEQYTHPYKISSKGNPDPKVVYLSDDQREEFRTFQMLQNYGMGLCVGFVGLAWLWTRLNEDRRPQ
jgi:hypothetical protein